MFMHVPSLDFLRTSMLIRLSESMSPTSYGTHRHPCGEFIYTVIVTIKGITTDDYWLAVRIVTPILTLVEGG
jgi:hypothetical protein